MTADRLLPGSRGVVGSGVRPHSIVRSERFADILGAYRSSLVDKLGDAHATHSVQGRRLYLVSPNGSIGFGCEPRNAEAVFGYLSRVLGIKASDWAPPTTGVSQTAKMVGRLMVCTFTLVVVVWIRLTSLRASR